MRGLQRTDKRNPNLGMMSASGMTARLKIYCAIAAMNADKTVYA